EHANDSARAAREAMPDKGSSSLQPLQDYGPVSSSPLWRLADTKVDNVVPHSSLSAFSLGAELLNRLVLSRSTDDALF
ncbi:hypothetical protein MRX96_052419, partial [Rhipicephalus microplus]